MESATKKQKIIQKLKTIGLAGFMFFFLKGMAWLAVGYFILK